MIDRTRRWFSSVLAPVLVASTVAASSGCIMHGKNKPFAYAGNAAMIIAGGVMLRTSLTTCSNALDHCPPPDHSVETTKLIGGSLLAIGAVGLALQLAGDLQPETVAPPPPEPTLANANSDDVHLLTQDAREAAKAGSYADVQSLADRVSVLDPPYYRAVFRADPDIRACLA